jgi:hypothetical protein
MTFHFHDDTNQRVKDVIVKAYNQKSTVRLFCGDSKTGKAWSEEFDTVGQIGRSTGTKQVPLLVPEGEDGGQQLIDDRIVGIWVKNFGFVYKHPNFRPATFTHVGKKVFTENKNEYANCGSTEQAKQLVSFMTGERFDHPTPLVNHGVTLHVTIRSTATPTSDEIIQAIHDQLEQIEDFHDLLDKT